MIGALYGVPEAASTRGSRSDTGGNEALSPQDRFNSGNDLVSVAFRHQSQNAGTSGHARQLGVQVHGTKENLAVRTHPRNFSRGFYPVDDRHGKIQDDDVGAEFPRLVDGILTVHRLATDFPVGMV